MLSQHVPGLSLEPRVPALGPLGILYQQENPLLQSESDVHVVGVEDVGVEDVGVEDVGVED
ncbi:MAG: hypothetical protein AAB340_01050, partial [Patescibacteria group bacterium]